MWDCVYGMRGKVVRRRENEMKRKEKKGNWERRGEEMAAVRTRGGIYFSNIHPYTIVYVSTICSSNDTRNEAQDISQTIK